VITAYVPVDAPLPHDGDPPLPEVVPTSKPFEFQVVTRKPDLRIIKTEAWGPFSFLVCTYADPRWKAYDQNHRPLVAAIDPDDPWGRLGIDAPAGTTLVSIQLEPTWSAYLGTAITMMTLGCLPLVTWRARARLTVVK